MDCPSVSVVIVSRHRPRLLQRCLKAIHQLIYPQFEIIVVACPDGARFARSFEDQRLLRVVDFDVPNISVARNFGIAHANGTLVAFIDDDAVPEPTWLLYLAEAFTDTAVAQCGGTTLGRNGLSVQNGASRVSLHGVTIPFPGLETEPSIIPAGNGLVPRLQGTNMAIRRSVLHDCDGFDPSYAFYLDETDLSMRIAASGGLTAHAPKAIVHHRSGASAFRTKDRTPRSVFEIAASMAVFHKLHTPNDEISVAKATFLHERRTWLLRHMQRGSLTPDDVFRLEKELHDGY